MNPIKNKLLCFLLFLLGLGSACNHKVSSEEEFYQWINDASHGLVKTKKVGELQFTMKYMPSGFLAYKEGKSNQDLNPASLDSLEKVYEKSLTFILTIGPSEKQKVKSDPMYKDLGSYEEYKARMLDMNFDFRQYLKLQQGGKSYQPVLCLMENTYSLSTNRTLYIVFLKNESSDNQSSESQEIDVVFTDDIFNTGINHFVFDPSDIHTANKIKAY